MLLLVGCNHRSTPVELRERLAFSEDELGSALERLAAVPRIHETLILSTCNRVEVLARTDPANDVRPCVESLMEFLAKERSVPLQQLVQHGYHFTGRETVRHVFQVASGLDSMILGEPQILGQVKQAFHAGRRAGTTGPVLERLMQQCLATAKRVRRETGISRNAVSVAFAAVSLARQIFGELRGRSALILGAGKMGELVARHLVSKEVGRIVFAGRTYSRAIAAAQRVGGSPIEWNAALEGLKGADIVVSCTGAPHPILDKAKVARALRGRRGQPLFLIDIAVPRDIDPAVNSLDNVYLYDIDGLQGVVDANLEQRRQAGLVAQKEIARDVDAFYRWRRSLEVTPTIVALRERLEQTGRTELERHRSRLGGLTGPQQQAVEELVRGLVRKILHRPVVHLRRSVDRGDTEGCTALYREIFNFEEPSRASGSERGEETTPPKRPGPHRILKGGKES